MVREDRISTLPQDLLIKILTHIPIKDVVTTMVLSKQWRFIWTMVPTLSYKENSNDDDAYIHYCNHYTYDETKKSVWWFLTKSLELHKAPVLEILSINLGPQCPTDADIGKVVANAVIRGLRWLRFKLDWSADPIILPSSLYTCKTLKLLTLSNKILVDFPSSYCLPSLLLLQLYFVTYKDEASLANLLSSCPILEMLCVKRKKDDNVTKFSVKVPSLLILNYCYHRFIVPGDNDVIDTGRCLVMDTPRLVVLKVTDYSKESYAVESMPCLEEAHIDVVSSLNMDKFFKSFSSVLSLAISLTTEMIISCSKIKFSHLKQCKISPWNWDWMDSLVPLLNNTPKLKSLIIDYGPTPKSPIVSASWREASGYHPECLKSSLENFEMIDYRGREEQQELMVYILTFAGCLKRAKIFFKSEIEFEDKETMMEELKAIPRSSSTSQLLFEMKT